MRHKAKANLRTPEKTRCVRSSGEDQFPYFNYRADYNASQTQNVDSGGNFSKYRKDKLLDPYGMSVNKPAKELHVPANRLSQIISGKYFRISN
jgi:hypothetical protein